LANLENSEKRDVYVAAMFIPFPFVPELSGGDLPPFAYVFSFELIGAFFVVLTDGPYLLI